MENKAHKKKGVVLGTVLQKRAPMDSIDHPQDQTYIKEYITANYSHKCTKEIAAHLGLSVSQVYNRAGWLQLKKTDEYIANMLQIEAERLKEHGKRMRFKKGHIPHNKGIKMPAEIYNAVKVSMFKKGNVPANTKYDGYESITKDGYVQVRIRQGKFALKHRLIWEEHNGKIPKGCVIVFKDRNKLNCALENLELITMAENMERNRVTKYPIELQTTIKKLNQLKKHINEKQN